MRALARVIAVSVIAVPSIAAYLQRTRRRLIESPAPRQRRSIWIKKKKAGRRRERGGEGGGGGGKGKNACPTSPESNKNSMEPRARRGTGNDDNDDSRPAHYIYTTGKSKYALVAAGLFLSKPRGIEISARFNEQPYVRTYIYTFSRASTSGYVRSHALSLSLQRALRSLKRAREQKNISL